MRKRIVLSLTAGSLLLLLLTGYLAWSTNAEMERTVTFLFGREQLILARKVARDIRSHFQFLRESLVVVVELWERDDREGSQHALGKLSTLLSKWNVLAMGRTDGAGGVELIAGTASDGPAGSAGPGIVMRLDEQALGLRLDLGGPAEEPRAGRTFKPEAGLFKGTRVMVLFVSRRPDDPGKGACFLVLDPLGIAQRYARDVRSGRTGYAWVIDQEAVFLSHYEGSFIDENSLTIRSQRNPHISYEQINTLVTEHLLKGEEGTDWYISGWHREIIAQEMKKLLAYSPVLFDGEDRGNLWSVGIVAPTEEIYGIIQPVLVRQGLVMGAIFFGVMAALAVLYYLSARWSQDLEQEVERKTKDLSRSEAETRLEHDRVRESMDKLIKTQELLVRSERFAAIGEAAAQLSHEIRNPLMIIGGFASQLRRNLPEDTPQSRKLAIIEEEARRLEALLAEMRDFTKPVKPCPEEGDINDLVEETMRLMGGDLEAREIRCSLELDRSLPRFPFDPRQIKQVLINLIKNAGESMPETGTLTIRSSREEGSARVDVVDTGAGIAPECLEKIFNPFFTTKCQGTGLGLTVAFRIMEDHGGRIEAHSEQGRGSIFSLIFPLTEPGSPVEDQGIEEGQG